MSRIIPALDIIDGNCVRLSQGKYDSVKVYANNPVDVAKSFEDAGIEYLHVVDLDGAKLQKPVNLGIVEEIIKQTNLKVDFGGGVKSQESLEKVFALGISQVTVGSLAVKEPDTVKEWLSKFGPDAIIIGVDTIKGEIATNGWLETFKRPIHSFIDEYIDAGAKYFLCTDITKDGMLEGPSVALYSSILERCEGCELIASGGVSDISDVMKLKEMGVEGIIIGKAIYEGKIAIDDLSTIAS